MAKVKKSAKADGPKKKAHFFPKEGRSILAHSRSEALRLLHGEKAREEKAEE